MPGKTYEIDGFPAPGLPAIQRLITGHRDDGKSYFLATDDGDHHHVVGPSHAAANVLYSTFEHPVNLNKDEDIKSAQKIKPGHHVANGTSVRVLDFAPGVESAMHRGESIDYNLVMEGEFELVLDSGESRTMRQGDFSVQRATAHKWKNVSGSGKAPGRLFNVLLDCMPVYVNDSKLEGFYGESRPYGFGTTRPIAGSST